jgi:hypothetical protein
LGGRVELIDDRGARAETDDFFRSRAFYDAEGVSHTLWVEGAGHEVAMPVLLREIGERGLVDAITPYGYPGAVVGEGMPPDPTEVDWSSTGLVSLFARDRLGHEPCFAGATQRSVVQIHDPSKERKLRSRFADQIRRNERLGYRVATVGGPDTSVEHRLAFHSVYTETMTRADAATDYFFTPEYFGEILTFEASWLLLCRTPEGATAAGAIAALSDGLLHYYLGGTADAHLDDSPFKNLADAMVDLADELDVRLNLGGGVRGGDGLEDFKRGFANAELPFHTHEIVCDTAAYELLSEGRPESGFFPRYRAP